MDFNFLNRNWKRIVQTVLNPAPDSAQPDSAPASGSNVTTDSEAVALLADQTRIDAPVLWLLGKVQSGKTSIIHAITRHPEAEIGAGFKPCTRHARQFEFPPELPLVRFIDTRGLDEMGYDPERSPGESHGESPGKSPENELTDIEHQADALLVVVRALDPQQERVLQQLVQIRKRHPDWPVILVQTRLHDAYKDDRVHPDYAQLHTTPDLIDLQRALKAQVDTFSDLPGKGPFLSVAVDLTKPEDQFTQPDYGLDALLDALDQVLSETKRQQLKDLLLHEGNQRLQQIHPHLIGYATAAGITDMIPVAGFITVPTLQGKMLHSIGSIYQCEWDKRTLTEFATSLGSGTLIGIGASFGARQLGKMVPVYGQSIGAVAAGTASAAVTYALGRAACYYLEQKLLGKNDPDGVARAYQGSLKEAYQMFHERLKRQKKDHEM